MKTSLSTKLIATAALAAAGLAVSSAAHAADVYFSVGVQPAQVYTPQRHVYVQPQPVYTPAPSHYGYRYDDRRYGAERRGPYGDHDRDGVANVYDPDSPRNQRRWARLYGPYGDLDRDGIMNQDDRDRDGDGISNRRDRLPDDPYRY